MKRLYKVPESAQLKAMRDTGQSFRVIAATLNKDGYRTEQGKLWSHTQVQRIVQREVAREEKQKDNPKVRIGKHPSDTRDPKTEAEYQEFRQYTLWEEETFEEWKANKAAMRKAQDEWSARREAERLLLPKDWADALLNPHDGTMWHKIEYFGELRLAGKDTWDKHIHELIAEQTAYTGKNVHALIDQIEGQPDVKGQLRRLWFGTLRELAMFRETYMAKEMKRRREAREARAKRMAEDPEGYWREVEEQTKLLAAHNRMLQRQDEANARRVRWQDRE